MSAGPIVLAAGGTGGHLFPAEALASALLARGVPVALVTDRRGAAFGDHLPEVPVHRVRCGTFGAGVAGKLGTLIELGRGAVQALALLRRLRPRAVIGFGGYPSVPTVTAAHLLRIPVALHEQNAVLGRANRLLVGRARRVATSFPVVAALPAGDRAKCRHTGNPVRPGFSGMRGIAYQAPAAAGPIRLLVLGGSQGARILSEVIPAALGLMPAALRSRIMISQQCRPEDLAAARTRLDGLGLAGLELSHFFADVPERLAACHLAICRSGASTVAELTTLGRPSILIPYPFAMDDHQAANAQALGAAGAAWPMAQDGLTPDTLAARLSALLVDPAALAAAAAAAAAWAVPDAAGALADLVLGIVHPQDPSSQPVEAAA